jgi:hypothetical protein
MTSKPSVFSDNRAFALSIAATMADTTKTTNEPARNAPLQETSDSRMPPVQAPRRESDVHDSRVPPVQVPRREPDIHDSRAVPVQAQRREAAEAVNHVFCAGDVVIGEDFVLRWGCSCLICTRERMGYRIVRDKLNHFSMDVVDRVAFSVDCSKR